MDITLRAINKSEEQISNIYKIGSDDNIDFLFGRVMDMLCQIERHKHAQRLNDSGEEGIGKADGRSR